MNRKMAKIFNRAIMMPIRFFYNKFNKHIILIHTPKCGGSYIHRQYSMHKKLQITPAGHRGFRGINVTSKSKIVGLIREPVDWYASYYYFCRKSLSEAPQGVQNFPISHPISLFSESGKKSFEEMITNMANVDYFNSHEMPTANIYMKDIDDVYEFMRRTGMGFWTWTMLYHFSKKKTIELKTRDDVLGEAKNIANYVDFIHQEGIDEDVERYLKLVGNKGKRINEASRPTRELPEKVKSLVSGLDGEVAKILGGY